MFMKKAVLALVALVSVVSISFSPIAQAANIRFSYSNITMKYPCQNATVTYSSKVLGTKGTPLSGAKVSLKVYYKTKTTSYTASTTNASGIATKNFRIGMATPDYTVKVVSKATKSGYAATSTTYFKPKSCSTP